MGSAVSNVLMIAAAPPVLTLSGVQGTYIQGGHLFNTSNLSWNSIPGCVNFKIYKQLTGGGFSLYLTQLASSTTYAPGISGQDFGQAVDWVYGQRDYYVVALDGVGGIITTSNTISLPWNPPVNQFQILAGSQTVVHEYDGYCNALHQPSLVSAMGTILPAGASVAGKVIDSFLSDSAPSSGPTLCLHGASGAETFTLSFTDANGVNQVLTGAAATKTAYSGGITFSWFVSGASMFLPGSSYTVTVS